MSTPIFPPGATPVNATAPGLLDGAIVAAVRRHSAERWQYEGATADSVADLWVAVHLDLLRAIAEAGYRAGAAL